MRAGDLISWQVQTPLLPPATVFYVLTGVANNVAVRQTITPSAVDSNGVAAFSLPSSLTGAWAPAKYQWVCFSTDASGNRTEFAIGTVTVLPDPGGATPVDPRTQNERILANIKCVLQGKSLDDVVMYKIGTREITKMSHKDLLYVEAIYESRVRKERQRRGEKTRSRNLGVRFGGC